MSHYDGQIGYEPAVWGDHAPFDTAWARQLNNNMTHLSEQSAQVLVNSPPVANGDGEQVATDTLIPRVVARFGPFQLRQRPDGESYRIRVRVRARITTATSTALWVVLHGAEGGLPYVGTESDNARSDTIASTASAWLSLSSDILWLDASAMELVKTSRPSVVGLGGDATDVQLYEGYVSLIAGATAGAPTVEMTGMYAAEYKGT